MDEPTNVLNADETGSHDRKNARHLWPEVTVICRACSLPGQTERLARDSAGNNVNCSPLISVHLPQVVQAQCIGPVLGEDPSAPGVNLNLAHDLPAAPCGGKREAAQPIPAQNSTNRTCLGIIGHHLLPPQQPRSLPQERTSPFLGPRVRQSLARATRESLGVDGPAGCRGSPGGYLEGHS